MIISFQLFTPDRGHKCSFDSFTAKGNGDPGLKEEAEVIFTLKLPQRKPEANRAGKSISTTFHTNQLPNETKRTDQGAIFEIKESWSQIQMRFWIIPQRDPEEMDNVRWRSQEDWLQLTALRQRSISQSRLMQMEWARKWESRGLTQSSMHYWEMAAILC